MNEKTIKAIKETLKHWDRMIRWSSKQPKEKEEDCQDMIAAIGETTGDTDCPLCKLYKSSCEKCPLKRKFGDCGVTLENLYKSVIDAKTWGEWTKNARLFRKQIASLLKVKHNE